MPVPDLTDEQCQDVVNAFRSHKTKTEAAASLGLHRNTFGSRLETAARRGFISPADTVPVMPGFEVTRVNVGPLGTTVEQKQQHGEVFKTLPGHRVFGESAFVDPEGRIIGKWIKTKEGELSFESIASILKDTFSQLEARARPITPPTQTTSNMLAVYPLIDWHIGLMAWAKETGDNYDLKIAQETIMSKMRAIIEATPPAEEAVVLGIGDMLHFDGYDPVTPRSKHQLDTDSRYPKVLATACDMVEETIELVAARHSKVTARILPGNHDPVSSVALALALGRVFRNTEHVTIDDDQSYNWWFRRGKVFLGGSHGDKTKMKDLPLVMAVDRPDDWAASTYRRIFTGHIHHERTIEEGGVIVTSMRSPVAKDAYHSFNRWRSGRSIYSEIFSLDGLEAGRLQFNI
ncbi:hypothetical protein [Rhizobium sp.]|uniref:hypothetical protein n=1 Tax=Rhizobium sp. TaxID=391 RepID=UPI003F80D322